MPGSSTTFVIGVHVRCHDGNCGELSRVVFNPVSHELTHLVVGPAHPRRQHRLVPLRLVESTDDEIRLACSRGEFDQLAEADESQFLLQPGGALGYAPDQVLALPYYGLGMDAVDGPLDPIPCT